MHVEDDEIEAGDGTRMTREQVRARVALLAPGIVHMRDVMYPTADTWLAMSEYAHELGAKADQYVLIIDLVDSRMRPRGAHKEMIQHTLDHVLTPEHIAFVQPGSALLRTVLKFIIASFVKRSSVHRDLEAALAAARDELHGATHRVS